MPRDSAAADRPASYLVGTASAFPLFFRDRTKPINQFPFTPSAKFPKSGSSCESRVSRIRKKSFNWPRYWVKSALRDEMWGTSDARLGCEERHAVQLRELRGAGSKGSSIAADPADCGRSAGGAVAGI